MKTVTLLNDHVVVDTLRRTLSIAELAEEPSLFSCNWDHAHKKGGDVTRDVLNRVNHGLKKSMKRAYGAGLHEVIDVRVQRLMPGMYPSIPGWHCDAVPRPNYFAQPDFSLVNKESFHVTCLIDTDETGQGISNTQFLNQDLTFKYNEEAPIWQQLHKQIEGELIRPHTKNILPGQLVLFSSFCPHRTTPTIKRGWRYFFRMSMYHNPPVANGIPGQQQVYVLSEENGW